MKAVLISARQPERRIALDSLPVMIGRDPSADVRLEDSWVGHYQCILDEDGDTLRVLDLGSRTGTFVNGTRIKRSALLPGDVLTVGRTQFVVQYERRRRRVAANENHAMAGRG
jgi:pSer/pThr/pTyr-binding forkhead associated (FHA) protein